MLRPEPTNFELRSNAPFVAICAALAAAIVVGALILIEDMRSRTIGAVERSLVGLSTVLSDQADRALQAVELTQEAVIQGLKDAKVANRDDFAGAASQQRLHETLRNRIASLPQANAITIIDHTGKLLNFSRYWPIPDVNISDRDYFKALAADPRMERFIGEPVRNRGDNAWTIYIARKITAPDGTFLGLVLGAIELNYFQHLYREITPGPDAVISIFRNDGLLLVRHPHRDGAIGRTYPRAGASIIAATAPGGGVVRNVSPIDNEDRLVSTRALATYPMIVSVSRTVQASLEPIQRQAVVIAGAATLLVGCLVGLAAMLIRQTRGQRELALAEAARAAAEERVRGERGLREQYARFGLALDNMTQGLCLFDADHRLIVMNARFVEMHGVPPQLQGRGTKAELIREHVLRRQSGAIDDHGVLLRVPQGDDASALSDVVDLTDGRAVNVVRAAMPGGGWVCTHEDITERRRSEERMRYLAKHDALTALPNRLMFEEVVARELAAGPRASGGVALLCVDLDGFKQVNDLFGHQAGDGVLIEMADRLQGILGERCVAARLGGDEFAILATGLSSSKSPAGAAEAVIRAISEPFATAGSHVDIGCSVGVAIFPQDGDDYTHLLSAADMALGRAKRDGKGVYRFFEPEMDIAARDRHALAHDLRAAIASNQLELHYQPQFEVATNRLSGFEALLRWHHPVRGPVSPVDFIPVAEETGLILALGEWVLWEACREAAHWSPAIGIAVNLSIAQFRQAGLADLLRSVLAETGLAPERLELEVTESLFLDNTTRSQHILTELKQMGVRISIDDFGTGYSSLLTLQSFPFDKLKIDRSFVSQIGVTDKGTAIVRAIIALGESLSMPVIAEGIETEAQLTFLRLQGCAEMQGFLRGRPKPIAAYREYVEPEPLQLLCA